MFLFLLVFIKISVFGAALPRKTVVFLIFLDLLSLCVFEKKFSFFVRRFRVELPSFFVCVWVWLGLCMFG